MKKVLIILIPLLILAGGGYWYYSNKSSDDTPTSIIQKMKKEEEKSVTGSLKDIVGLGSSMKCTWKTDDISATSWIKKDKVYTETTLPDGKTNTIFVDGCVWNWNDGDTAGIKVCYDFDEEEMEKDLEDFTEGLESYAESLEQQGTIESADEIKYDCSKAVISDSKFNPPSNITFTSWDDLMESSFEDLPEGIEFTYE